MKPYDLPCPNCGKIDECAEDCISRTKPCCGHCGIYDKTGYGQCVWCGDRICDECHKKENCSA